MRIFLNKDDSVLIPVPNFFRFEDASLRIGAKIFHVDTWMLRSDIMGKKIIETIQIVNPKIIWLSNPNSVTGELIPKNIIKNILSFSKNSILIVDEAFVEYVDESNSCADMIDDHSNLIILRTFSKLKA